MGEIDVLMARGDKSWRNKVMERLYGPLIKIEDRKLRNSYDSAIPPIVIQTWETKKIRLAHFVSVRKFRWMNRDLGFKLISAEERDSYMESSWGHRKILEIYKSAQYGAMKADIFRYCFIYEHGGYYFDISKGLKVKLTELIREDCSGVISFEANSVDYRHSRDKFKLTANQHLMHPDNLVIQWGFGFAPQHKLLGMLIDNIEKDFPLHKGVIVKEPRIAIHEFTGPVQFTKAIWQFMSHEQFEPKQLCQLGIDFYGEGIYSMLGSGWRHQAFPSYWTARNSSIC
jgi:mannosyltransferase OCH1-like enzyme